MSSDNTNYVFIGEIRRFPYMYSPDGFFSCDGQILKCADYTPLFALIGNRFGGTSPYSFQLPNLNKDNTGDLQYLKYYIAYEGNWPASPPEPART